MAANVRLSALERAFELARSGNVSNISEIMARLSREGYAPTQIEGPVLLRQLRALVKQSQAQRRMSSPSQS